MKKSIFKAAAVLMLAVMTLVLTVVPSFAAAYTTYTYSIDGKQLDSPNAYEPEANGRYNSERMGITQATGLALERPSDLTVDCDGNIYIIDEATRAVDDTKTEKVYRIIVLDPYFRFLYELTEFKSESGATNYFNKPEGLSTTEKFIYVADTENSRIVVFERLNEGRTKPERSYKIISQPQADVFGSDNLYLPIAVASDDNHVYVVSKTTHMGIISMDIEGNFMGFVGAQKVSSNALDILWRMFQTDEQRALSQKYISTPFNNIVMDDAGFIYVTINFESGSAEEASQQTAIENKSGSAEYAPVKKLNTNGDDILSRSGFYPPSGEVLVAKKSTNGAPAGASTITDVAIGPEETWSIIDSKRQRIFTYDKNGNLLFAFGDKGDQLGNIEQITALSYQLADGMTNMIILDKGDGAISKPTINVYSRTEYGDLLIKALHNDNTRNYEAAVEDYERILERNLNFDAAYIGKAKALYRKGGMENYEAAMEQYSYAYNTDGYSQAFKMFRKNWVSEYIWVIPIVVVAVFLGISYFFKYAAKVNAKTAITSGKRTFGQELLFAFHLIFHPFDGYWDLKHEKRGSLRGSAFYIALTVLVFTYQSIGRSYMYNPTGEYQSIGMQIATVCIPVALFAAANWCITTLFDGEGSIKDIVIATGYSLVPLILFTVPGTLLTHILSSSESGIITLVNALGFVWTGLLLFFGIMITQDYSFGKNILTIIVTIVGMCFIMFIIILFVTLVSDIFGLGKNIITEISYR